MVQPWNLGPGLMDFSALGNLGKTYQQAADASQKRDFEEQRRQTFAALGQGAPDYNKFGLALLGQGDVTSGAALIGLGQKADERKQNAETLRSWGSGDAAVPAATGTPQASLINNESGGRWDAQNDAVGAGGARGHFGRVQFGQARLQEAEAAGAIPPGTTPQAFMASPEIQKRAEAWHFNDIDQSIKANGFDKLVGQPINGVPVTVEGMRAVAHLGGKEGLRKFILSGGKYNPEDENGTRLSDYFARHGGGGGSTGAQVAQAGVAPVQVAENEADVQRLEAAQAGTPMADAPAPGAVPAQGFAVPGADAPAPSIANDPKVKLWSQRLASSTNERLQTIAKQQLDLAMKDAELRYNEGKSPEAVREWQYARKNGMTEAKNPIAYAKEKADATRADTAPVTRQIKQGDGSEVAVQWNPEARRWDPLTAPEGGNAVKPSGGKLTEGQSKDLVFHNRGIQALEAFEPVAEAYAVGKDRLASQIPGGNYVVPEKFQMAQQSGRNFLASILRKDSGAAITAPEEAQYGGIFLPQPGDKPGTLAQKAEARKQAIDAIRNGLGTAEVLALGQRLTTRNPGEAAPEKPAAPLAPPKLGHSEGGYRFKGGDPSKPESWVKVN